MCVQVSTNRSTRKTNTLMRTVYRPTVAHLYVWQSLSRYLLYCNCNDLVVITLNREVGEGCKISANSASAVANLCATTNSWNCRSQSVKQSVELRMLRCLVAAKLTAPFAASYRQQFDDPWTVRMCCIVLLRNVRIDIAYWLRTLLRLNRNKAGPIPLYCGQQTTDT